MNWFYSDNGAQRGPVDDAQFDQLVASGAISPSTLVWHEGMANWQPCSVARPAAGGEPVPNGVVCAGCGVAFPEDEVVRVESRFVCANCKPKLLQQMREGVDMSGALRGTLSEAELLNRDYSVDISGCLDRSWRTFAADPGVTIGASILAYLVLIAGAVIPFIGGIVQIILQGAVMGGVWNFYIRKARSQNAGIAEAFAGFGPRFGQLLLSTLIPVLIVFAVMAVLVVPVFIFGGISMPRPGGGGVPGGVTVLFVVLACSVGLVAFVSLVFLQMMWLFAPALVIDKGYSFWSALELSRKMVLKRPWSTLGLCIVSWLIAVVGVAACGIGLLVSGPVAFGMLAQHYDRVFGDVVPQS